MEPDEEPEDYVGLDAGIAETRALEQGWSVVRMLPPGAIITMEYQMGRLNFTVQNGIVRRCWKG